MHKYRFLWSNLFHVYLHVKMQSLGSDSSEVISIEIGICHTNILSSGSCGILLISTLRIISLISYFSRTIDISRPYNYLKSISFRNYLLTRCKLIIVIC